MSPDYRNFSWEKGSVPMLSYNGEPITLQIIKNGFNACRHQQYCIKAKCKSPSRSYQEAKVR